jgi:hypothetical protein
MDTNQLIFSRSGGADKLYKVNPLLFPQQHLANAYQLPDSRDLPSEGLELRFLTFDFGFATPGSALAPFDLQPYGIPIGRNFLATAITGASIPASSLTPPAAGSPGAVVSPAFLFNFFHTHEGVQRQWFNKDVTDVTGLGDGKRPRIFRAPILLVSGDTLTCQVRNLSNCTLQVQIMLAGGEF